MEPLVTPAWLETRLAGSAIRVVDVRWYLADPAQGRREYDKSHIPGAVHLDVDADLSAANGPGRHPLPSPSDFAATLGTVGLSNRDTVIAYDSAGGAIAARLWWMLRDVGHTSVAVLDGGWQAWRAAGGPTSSTEPEVRPSEFVVGPSRNRTIDRATLQTRLGRVRLIDARAAERYQGVVEPIDAAAGHIPSAVSFPHTANLDADGRLLDPRTLRSMYGESPIPTVAYCGSGVTSCHTILAHVVAGLPEPMLYVGSWSDWAAAGGAVAVGMSPGQP